MSEPKRIKFVSSSRNGNDSQLTISGLSVDELEKLEAALLRGWQWAKGNGTETGLIFSEAYARPPKATDEEMLPFWRGFNNRQDGLQLAFKNLDDEYLRGGFSFHLSIQSLCGFKYSPENYRTEAEKLESYGFACLRSRRDPNEGRFWEIWYLPGFWAAKGALKDVLDGVKSDTNKDPLGEKAKLKRAITFLCRHSSFGTLDASVQRAAMVMDD